MKTDWVICNNRILIRDSNSNEYVDFCEAFEVESVIIDPFTQRWKIVLLLYTEIVTKKVLLHHSEINRDIIKRLVPFGLRLPDTAWNAAILQSIIFQQEDTAEHEFQHSNLGFVEVANETGFLGNEVIGFENEIFVSSTYCQAEKTASQGTVADWVRGAEKLLLDHPPLELGVALAAVAPVAFMLNKKGKLSFFPLVGIIGRSSSGKSTLLKLMASMWGHPNERQGLIESTYATTQAFFKKLSQHSGFPIFIDECTGATGINFTEVLYALPGGNSKSRLDPSGEAIEPTTFFSTTFITSERSILKQTSGSHGLYFRILEFELPWTKSEEHAKQLQQFYETCYGTVWKPLIQLVLDADDEIVTLYERQRVKLVKKCSVESLDAFTYRLLDTLAVITTAARFVKAATGLKLSVGEIEELLLKEIKNLLPASSEPADMAYKALKQFFVSNRSRFSCKQEVKKYMKDVDEALQYSSRDWWGQIESYQGKNVIWMLEEKFDFVLQKEGISPTRTLLKSMRDRGYLIYHKDRYVKEHAIAGSKVATYCIVNE